MRKTLLAVLFSVILASSFSARAEDEISNNFNVSGSIEYNQNKFEKKVIFNTNEYEIVLFAFTKQQGLKEHTVPFDAFLQILEGEALLIMDGVEYNLKTGEGIKLKMNKSHALKAQTDFKMILTKQKGKIL